MSDASDMAAYNAAVTAAAVLYQAYVDNLAAGAKYKIVFCPGNINGTALATGEIPNFGATASAAGLDQEIVVVGKVTATTNMLYNINGRELGRIPLFWKLAASGSDSLAEA